MRLHHPSASLLRSLNSVSEDADAVAFLLDAETSRRLLVLRVILDAAAERPQDAGDVQRSWQLLETAERADPAAFRAVLLDPQVGVWAATLLRRLSRPESAEAAAQETPLDVELGFLGQLAASVLIAVGADFHARVPVREGRVFLPGLGRATVGGARGIADVRAYDGVVQVAAGGDTVTLPGEREHDAPGWEGLRRLRTEHAGVALSLPLDDLGPYSPVPKLAAAGRLSAERFADWQCWFDHMWPVLVDDHPASARALAAGLRSVVPLPRGERLRARAASSSDAFGCLLLSQPDEDEAVLPAQLGVALVHEFRHTLLNGLIFLTPLFEECGDLFHAPWRDDPRPLGGLVHGAYAFSGVVRYWRRRGTEGLAGFEFALWRSAVRAVLGTLRGHPALTPQGRALVDALHEQTAPWHEEPVGGREQRLACLATIHHHATWRAHHLRTSPAHAEELARAWTTGQRPGADTRAEPEPHAVPGVCSELEPCVGSGGRGEPGLRSELERCMGSAVRAEAGLCPESASGVGSGVRAEAGLCPERASGVETALRTEPELRPDPQACRLDSLALLARLSLIAPGEFDALRATEDPARQVPGVAPADLALVDGDAEAAIKLYAEELTEPGARPAAWAGLGLALAECGEPAAGAALTEHPELALAVSRSLPTPPDPVALAHWLAR